MKVLLLIIISLLICVLLTFNKEENNYDNDNFSFSGGDNLKYYDENGQRVNHKRFEVDEQIMAQKYIDPEDIVLELGARYGTVSVVTSKIVENKGKLVAVEPDNTILPALYRNREINDAKFDILDKCISNKAKKLKYDGYSTMLIDSDTPTNNNITYDEFKKLYPYKFNVLIADCEGCLEEFLDTIGSDINNYNKILFEADQSHVCNYDRILQYLQSIGFRIIENKTSDASRYYLKK